MDGTTDSLNSLFFSNLSTSPSPPSTGSLSTDSRRGRPDDSIGSTNPLCTPDGGRKGLDGLGALPRLVLVEAHDLPHRHNPAPRNSVTPPPFLSCITQSPHNLLSRMLSSAITSTTQGSGDPSGPTKLLLHEISISFSSFTCLPLEGHPIFVEIRDSKGNGSVCMTTKPLRPTAVGDLACARWSGNWTVPMTRRDSQQSLSNNQTAHSADQSAEVDLGATESITVQVCLCTQSQTGTKHVFAQKDVRLDHLNVRKDCRYSLQCRFDGSHGLLTVVLKSLTSASGTPSSSPIVSPVLRPVTEKLIPNQEVRWKNTKVGSRTNSIRRRKSLSTKVTEMSPTKPRCGWWRTFVPCL